MIRKMLAGAGALGASMFAATAAWAAETTEALGGAAAGAVIGNQSGRAGEGALIGAGVGAAGGAAIGNAQDQENRRRYYEGY